MTMIKKEYFLENKEETRKLAKIIFKEIIFTNLSRAVLLQGELGAGKTFFAGEIIRLAGTKDAPTSPTFVIMKEYEIDKNQILEHSIVKIDFKKIYHIDCYRINSAKEILDLGWKDIIEDSGCLVLVEWPEKIKTIWPKKFVKISFEVIGENERKAVIEIKK